MSTGLFNTSNKDLYDSNEQPQELSGTESGQYDYATRFDGLVKKLFDTFTKGMHPISSSVRLV
ncbi:hypothetical protein LQ567_06580 [Niabella pedocola]|uniref:Uncharacterized protein n=1 Tax=Niabella pedocola TaxID=1752077 RepID=A0ABS8PRE5_9BACT|nr:hypothetical protein [Niabella pedocola]MCD2422421.1 hypothetical protein [Niabella pedocola]